MRRARVNLIKWNFCQRFHQVNMTFLVFFKVIPSTGSKLKRPTPAFHSSRTSLAGDTSNSSSPVSTGAKTNRAGKDLPQHFSTGDKDEGAWPGWESGNSSLSAALLSSLRSREGEKHRCSAQRTAGSNLASRSRRSHSQSHSTCLSSEAIVQGRMWEGDRLPNTPYLCLLGAESGGDHVCSPVDVPPGNPGVWLPLAALTAGPPPLVLSRPCGSLLRAEAPGQPRSTPPRGRVRRQCCWEKLLSGPQDASQVEARSQKRLQQLLCRWENRDSERLWLAQGHSAHQVVLGSEPWPLVLLFSTPLPPCPPPTHQYCLY